jgi:hypothetical protein
MPMNSFQPPGIIFNNSDDDTIIGNDKRHKIMIGGIDRCWLFVLELSNNELVIFPSIV